MIVKLRKFLSVGTWLASSKTYHCDPGEQPRDIIVSEVVSFRVLGMGFESLRQLFLLLYQRLWRVLILWEVHIVMSFFVHLEAVRRWVVLHDVERENSSRRLRSRHVPNNCFCSHPAPVFANELEKVFYPTNTIRTQLYIHLSV